LAVITVIPSARFQADAGLENALRKIQEQGSIALIQAAHSLKPRDLQIIISRPGLVGLAALERYGTLLIAHSNPTRGE